MEVQAWVKAQADHASKVLGNYPERDKIIARLQELEAGAPYRTWRYQRHVDGSLYYLRQEADEDVAKLYVRDGRTGEVRMLLDPMSRKPESANHSTIQFFAVSPDGKHMLYGLTEDGSEDTVVHILDIASGVTRDDESIDRLEPYYLSPKWLPDSSGFLYVRLPDLPPGAPPTEGYKNSRVYLHRLGDKPEEDRLMLGVGTNPRVEIASTDFPGIATVPGSEYMIAQIKHGDANEISLYAAPLSALEGGMIPWQKIGDQQDGIVDYAVLGSDIYLVTSSNAPRFKVVRTSLEKPDFPSATTVFPAADYVVESVSASQNSIYVNAREDGIRTVYRLDPRTPAKPVRLTLPGNEAGLVVNANPQFVDVWINTVSWVRRGRTYRYDPRDGSFVDLELNPRGKFDDVKGYAATQVKVKSHDGTLVPLSILHREGVELNGKNRVYLIGYGAYGISIDMFFSPTLLAWLERDIIIAFAHVRGGGEYGKEWHLAGQKATKPNTWKDFIACAEYLVREKYTTPSRLVASGDSAGGILIGRAITERPDLFAAAIINVGANDMIRMETTTNGVPNIAEFGTVAIEEEFHALLMMSPFHHVQDGVKYPAVLLTHGINDPRVEPWMSAKMAARLQAATASGKPVLLSIDYGAGHGIGSTRTSEHLARANAIAFAIANTEAP